MKIAIVHDELTVWGGAERLLLAIAEIWPDAPIYTSIYDQRLATGHKQLAKLDIHSSWMQKLPFRNSLRRAYFPLYPLAFESFDFSEPASPARLDPAERTGGFDIVLSTSTRFAHGIITKPKTLHICYFNSPPRFLWDTKRYLKAERFGKSLQFILQPLISYLRVWDETAAARVDFWIANSNNVARKIKKIYHQDSEVVYPFVDLDKFKPKDSKLSTLNSNPYYLVVSRLLPWKRIDIAIDLANQLRLPLKIIGEGPDKNRLKKLAGSSVELLGEVADDKLINLYQHATATIITQDEDFGIVSLESQACGTPVIAYKAGGNLETIVEGETGVFFHPQETEALKNVIINFSSNKFDPEKIRANAEKFSKRNFQSKLQSIIQKKWQQKNLN